MQLSSTSGSQKVRDQQARDRDDFETSSATLQGFGSVFGRYMDTTGYNDELDGYEEDEQMAGGQEGLTTLPHHLTTKYKGFLCNDSSVELDLCRRRLDNLLIFIIIIFLALSVRSFNLFRSGTITEIHTALSSLARTLALLHCILSLAVILCLAVIKLRHIIDTLTERHIYLIRLANGIAIGLFASIYVMDGATYLRRLHVSGGGITQEIEFVAYAITTRLYIFALVLPIVSLLDSRECVMGHVISFFTFMINIQPYLEEPGRGLIVGQYISVSLVCLGSALYLDRSGRSGFLGRRTIVSLEQDKIDFLTTSVSEGILIVDSLGNIRSCNEAARNIFRVKQLKSKTLRDFFGRAELSWINWGLEQVTERTHKKRKRRNQVNRYRPFDESSGSDTGVFPSSTNDDPWTFSDQVGEEMEGNGMFSVLTKEKAAAEDFDWDQNLRLRSSNQHGEPTYVHVKLKRYETHADQQRRRSSGQRKLTSKVLSEASQPHSVSSHALGHVPSVDTEAGGDIEMMGVGVGGTEEVNRNRQIEALRGQLHQVSSLQVQTPSSEPSLRPALKDTTSFQSSTSSMVGDTKSTATVGTELILMVIKDTSLSIRSHQMLAKASRTQELFLANVSHELLTPLNCIIGLNNYLLNSNLSAIHQRRLKLMESSSMVLTNLINEIITFSELSGASHSESEGGIVSPNVGGHGSHGQTLRDEKPFNFLDMVENVIDMMELEAWKKKQTVVIETDVKYGLLDVVGNSNSFRTILFHLISNAMKFNKVRGDVVIKILRDQSRQTLLDGDIRLRVEVVDDGIGINSLEQASLFTTMGQIDSSYNRTAGGFGLGLALCKKIVDQNLKQGQIGVESEVGVGSTFWFEFELYQSANDSMRSGTSTSSSAGSVKKSRMGKSRNQKALYDFLNETQQIVQQMGSSSTMSSSMASTLSSPSTRSSRPGSMNFSALKLIPSKRILVVHSANTFFKAISKRFRFTNVAIEECHSMMGAVTKLVEEYVESTTSPLPEDLIEGNLTGDEETLVEQFHLNQEVFSPGSSSASSLSSFEDVEKVLHSENISDDPLSLEKCEKYNLILVDTLMPNVREVPLLNWMHEMLMRNIEPSHNLDAYMSQIGNATVRVVLLCPFAEVEQWAEKYPLFSFMGRSLPHKQLAEALFDYENFVKESHMGLFKPGFIAEQTHLMSGRASRELSRNSSMVLSPRTAMKI